MEATIGIIAIGFVVWVTKSPVQECTGPHDGNSNSEAWLQVQAKL